MLLRSSFFKDIFYFDTIFMKFYISYLNLFLEPTSTWVNIIAEAVAVPGFSKWGGGGTAHYKHITLS